MTARAARSLRARLALTTTLAGGILAWPAMAAAQTAPQTTPVGIASSAAISGEAGAAQPTFAAISVTTTPTPTSTLTTSTTTVSLNARNTVVNWGSLNVLNNAASGGPAVVNQTLNFTNATGSAAGTTVAVLNRVAAGTTTLTGTVSTTANGNGSGVEVWLSNPNGIIIGDGAAISTNGLVLTTLDVTSANFLSTSNTSVNAASALAGDLSSITSSGNFTIATNGGVLAVIAPVVQLAGTNAGSFTAGTGNAAFAAATDVTLQLPNSPLSLTINRGTTLAAGAGSALSIGAPVTANTVALVLSAQQFVDTLLNVSANVTATAASGTGIVILAGNGTTNPDSASLVGFGSGDVAGGGIVTQTGAVNAGLSTLVLGARATPANLPATPAGAGTIAASGLTAATLSAASDGDLSITGSNAIATTVKFASSGGQVALIGDTAALTVAGAGASGTAATIATAGALTINAPVQATTGATSLTGAGGITLYANVSGGTAASLNNAVTLGAAATVSAGSAGTVNFAGTVVGGYALTVAAGGTKTFNGTVGAGAGNVLASLTSTGAGTTAFGAGATTVTTSGNQSYGAVALGTDTTFTGVDGGFGGTITGNGYALDLKFSGTTTLNAVGGVSNFTSEGGGTTTLNGNVTTSGAQVYNDAVTTTVAYGTIPMQTLTSTTSSGITFNSTLDGTVATAGSRQQLALSTTGGATVFNGAVGAATPFANLTIGGAATVNANVTADAPVFNGAVTVTGVRTIATAPVFNGTVAGPGSLILTGGGTASQGFGAGTALGALTVNGALGLTGNVATMGTQAYNGILTITGDAILSGSAATFNGANSVRPATLGSGNLSLNFTGAQALDGGIVSNGTQGFGSVTVGPAGGTAGATTTLTGTFLATNGVTFNNAATLGGNVVVAVSSTSGSASVNGTLDATTAGVQGLTVNTPGTTNFTGTIGGTAALAALITDTGGTTQVGASITANTQTYNDAVTVGAGIQTLTASSGLTFAGTVIGPGGLSLAGGGAKAFNGTVGAGTGNALASVSSAGAALTIAGGSVTTTGAQTYFSGIVLGSAATVLTGTTGAGAQFSAGLISAGGNALTLDFAGAKALNGSTATGLGTLVTQGAGATTLSNTITTSGTQTYNDAILLGTAPTTTVSAGANAIAFNGSVDGTAANTQGLAVNTSGQTSFAGPVGNTAILTSLTTTSGPVAINTTSIKTTGLQSYGGAVTLGANVVLAAGSVTFTGGLNGNSSATDHDLTLTTPGAKTIDGTFLGLRNFAANGGGTITLSPSVAGITTSGSQTYGDPTTLGAATLLVSTGAGAGTADIIFGSTLNGAQALTVNTAGTTAFNGVVGGLTPLTSITTNAAGTTSIGTNAITTSGLQLYNDPVTLAVTSTLASNASGAITFAGAVNGATQGGQALTVSTAGLTTFGGAVGGATTGPGANTQALSSLTTNLGGTTAINGGSVYTTTAQTYADAVTLGANTVLTSGMGPTIGTISFGSSVNGNTSATDHDLTLTTTGAKGISGSFGGVRNLIVNGGGATALSGVISTSGTQSYADAVTLNGAMTTLTSTASGVGGNADISLLNTVDAAAAGVQGLTVNTAGKTIFAQKVGFTTALASITTDAPGTTVVNGGYMGTTGAATGAQTYNDQVTLGAATTFAATSLAFGGGVGSAGGGGPGDVDLTLTVTGAKTVDGNTVLTGIRNLLVNGGGATTLRNTITTSGTQTYGDAVTLGTATTTTTSTGAAGVGAAITFSGTVGALTNGGQGLVVNTGGVTTFAQAVGGTPAGTTKLAFLTTDAGGTTALNGGTVVTTGNQTYNDAAALGVDTRLVSTANGTLAFGGTVNGARLLSFTTSGLVQLGGVLGGVTPINGLAVRAGSFSAVAGNRVGTVAANVAGGFAYDDAAALTVGTVDGLAGVSTGTAAATVSAGGLLTLAANVAAGNISLTGTGITQTAGSSVNAGAGTILLDANDGAFTLAGTLTTTNATGTAVVLRDSAAAVLGTIVTGAGGTTTLGAAAGDNLGGNVTQTAGSTITTGTLIGSVGGSATLTNAGNAITTLGGLSANGLALRDSSAGLTVAGPVAAGTGNLALTLDSGTLALTGTLTAATGTVALTSGGTISQTGGAIIADTLTSSSTGGASLTAAGNVITRLAGFTNNGSGGFALNNGRSLTLTTDATTAGDLTINAIGLDFTGRSVSATGAVTLGGGTGAATLAQTTAGAALAVTAAGITTTGLSKAGTTVTFTSGGAINAAAVQAGTDATFDANGTATLAAVTAGSSSGITVRALDAAITGALTASKVSFVNRSPTTVTVKLGDNSSAGGFQLSQAEVNQVNAGTLIVDAGAGNVEFSTLALANAAGSSAVNVLATGRIDVKGAVSGTGSGRLIRLGGTAATTSDKASVIEVTATPTGGGSLSFGTADLELRGSRIGVGQAPGFLTPIGFDGATGLSVATVSTAFVANANSSLYNSTYGGGAYQPNGATLVSARTLTVRYTDYALFQNTGSVGTNAGVVLGGTSGAPVNNALSINADGGGNAFALFGTINGISGSGTALLGSQVISFAGANLANTRVNGCLVGSGAGCLSSVVSQPVLNVFDSSRLNIFRSADDLAVPFDPVVGNNNEALFSGASIIDAPVTGTECAGSDDPACKPPPPQDNKAPQAAGDRKGT